jgi:type IV secretory pathway VirB10-like protein
MTPARDRDFSSCGISAIAAGIGRGSRRLEIRRYQMNRNVLIGAVVVLLAAGAYYQFSYRPAQEAAAAGAAATEAATEAATDAAATATEAATEAATDAAATATEAATDAAATATEAATDAAAAATDAAATATEAATDAAAAATEAATEAAGAATTAVTDAAAAAAAALDPANFNVQSVTALIDGSSLDDATKATLRSAVEAAGANPELVQAAIDQVKAALGM